MQIKKEMKKIGALLLAGSLAFGGTALRMPEVVYATEAIEAEKQKTESEIGDIEKKRQEAKDQADQLQDQADALNNQLTEYTSKLEAVNRKIEETQQAISGTEEDIANLEQELAVARADEEAQYASMKQRIAYFYERNMGRNILTVILECGSIADIVSTLEYLDAVFAYDRSMLKSYQALQQAINEKTAALEQSRDNLNSYQEDLNASQDEMDILVGLKKNEVAEAEDAARIADLSVEEYESQLALLMNKMQSLQAQADAAQAELARQLAAQQAAMEAEYANQNAAAEKAAAAAQAEAAAEEAERLAQEKRGLAETAMNDAAAAAQGEDEQAKAEAAARAEEAEKEAEDAEARAAQLRDKADTMQNTVNTGGNTGSYPINGATPGSVAVSESDIMLLAATVQAEADNQGDQGRLAVATVIMNRVDSPLFPNTVPGVVQQQQQFASWRSGAVSLILQRGPNENCIRAARQAVAGTRLGTWLFFMTKPAADGYGITGYQQIGDHVFFWKWGAN